MYQLKSRSGVRAVIALVSFLFLADAATAQTRFQYLMDIGNGPGTALAQFNSPTGIAIGDVDDADNAVLFVADTGNNRIQTITFDPLTTMPADVTELAGPGTGDGEVMSPHGLAVADVDGDVLPDVVIADTGNRRVWVYPGNVLSSPKLIAGPGSGLGEVESPQGVAAQDAGPVGGAGGHLILPPAIPTSIC